jgi:Chromo (CHRromatin Organisation MOdifier) domain
MKRKRKKVVHQKSSSADDALGQISEEDVDADRGEGSSPSDGEFYNVDHIVNGPNKVGKYEVKWEGYDSDQNTWEKAIGLPQKVLDEYASRSTRDHNTSSSSDDDEPIVKRLQRGVYTA